MARIVAKRAMWLALYTAVVVCPLVFAAIGFNDGPRGFWREFAVALGFVGLAMMGLQLLLIARIRFLAAPFGEDTLVVFHRYIGYVGTVLVLLHPVLLIVLVDPSYIVRVIPWTAPWAGRFGTLAILCLVVVIVTSAFRKRLRISYEWWQATHLVLSAVAIIAAVIHVELIDYYVNQPWKRVLWIVMSAGLIAVFVWVRLVRPAIRLRRPWVVESVVPQPGGIASITFRPVGHPGFTFAPGQFGWLSLHRSPFALTQHPFSFASNGDDSVTIQMGIKALGDFTRTIPHIAPGTRAHIDGPYGAFTPDRHPGPGLVFIAGGVGISPMMSMIRTLAARGDRRACHLFYGVNTLDDVAFGEELGRAKTQLDLSVTLVVVRPEPDWSGETGFIDADVLRRRLPADRASLQYFICGPGALQNAMTEALRDLHVPAANVHTEHFDFV